MRLIRIALVAMLLIASATAIGLPRTDGYLTHWYGTGWLMGWSWIRYADEGSVQVCVRGSVILDWYWINR